MTLSAEKNIEVRFSEIDSMNIVWHGSYALYFEDAREAFGKKFGLEYLFIYNHGFYAPIVEMNLTYKKPLRYQDKAKIVITYRPTDAAKIIFDYQIFNSETNELLVQGYSVQVFLTHEYKLVWSCPDFYNQWKQKNGLL